MAPSPPRAARRSAPRSSCSRSSLAGVLAAYLILAGVASEASGISGHLQRARDKIQGWLQDIGVSDGKAQQANQDVTRGASDSFHALLPASPSGSEELSSLVFFLAMTVLSLFFLLKDGPVIRSWIEGHMGVPADVGRTITGRSLQSLRGYFLGVTIVGDVQRRARRRGVAGARRPACGHDRGRHLHRRLHPLPRGLDGRCLLGAARARRRGAGGGGGMVVIQLLSNGPLQQIVQPIAYGAALGLHPLAVLVLTIAGGALFGTVGLILAAPVASAIVRISADLERARGETDAEARAGARAPAIRSRHSTRSHFLALARAARPGRAPWAHHVHPGGRRAARRPRARLGGRRRRLRAGPSSPGSSPSRRRPVTRARWQVLTAPAIGAAAALGALTGDSVWLAVPAIVIVSASPRPRGRGLAEAGDRGAERAYSRCCSPRGSASSPRRRREALLLGAAGAASQALSLLGLLWNRQTDDPE